MPKLDSKSVLFTIEALRKGFEVARKKSTDSGLTWEQLDSILSRCHELIEEKIQELWN